MFNVDANSINNNCILSPNALNDIDPDENFYNEVHDGLQVQNGYNYFSIQQYNSLFKFNIKYLNFMAFNIRSYNRNNESFKAVIESLYKLPEIIVLTETWLTPEDHGVSLLDGYSERRTIRQGGRSGGVSVLCVGGINVRPMPELTVSNDTIESCVVQIHDKNDIFVEFAVYRPHSDTIEF